MKKVLALAVLALAIVLVAADAWSSIASGSAL